MLRGKVYDLEAGSTSMMTCVVVLCDAVFTHESHVLPTLRLPPLHVCSNNRRMKIAIPMQSTIEHRHHCKLKIVALFENKKSRFDQSLQSTI